MQKQQEKTLEFMQKQQKETSDMQNQQKEKSDMQKQQKEKSDMQKQQKETLIPAIEPSSSSSRKTTRKIGALPAVLPAPVYQGLEPWVMCRCSEQCSGSIACR
ncbi:hypothetical protein GCK32_000668 [Trichostrongylus colubriformis]|uniref:Uncharacterized protein n=1 Tax=Trichostrongylus colubriformis TaxID=6319 RepID=A0AAN8FGF9_TRICO